MRGGVYECHTLFSSFFFFPDVFIEAKTCTYAYQGKVYAFFQCKWMQYHRGLALLTHKHSKIGFSIEFPGAITALFLKRDANALLYALFSRFRCHLWHRIWMPFPFYWYLFPLFLLKMAMHCWSKKNMQNRKFFVVQK